MERFDKERVKSILIFVLILSALIVPLAVAFYTLSMNFSWNYEYETIQAYKDDGCTDPWTDIDTALGTFTTPTLTTHYFYIKNVGTTTVDVTITNEVLSGATVTWTPTSLTGLAVGDHNLMTLELSVSGPGGYSFDFTSTAT